MSVEKAGLRRFAHKVVVTSVTTLFLLPIVGLYLSQQASAFSGGTGVIGDPFEIANIADLLELNSYSGATHAGKYFELVDDINLGVTPYNTGSGWTPLSSFQGHFDGNGHTISNLYINTTGSSKGLFSSLAGATEFKNLNITGASVTSNNQNIGVLAGSIASRTVTNVSVAGTVSVSGSNGLIGGLTGAMSLTTANNVSSSVNVTASSVFTAVGGLVGNTDSGSAIRRSFSTGSVTSTSGETGGLVALNLLDCPVGGQAVINIVFTSGLKPADVVARKFNEANKAFTTLTQANSSVSVTSTTLEGKPAVQVQYVITDGGELDQDGAVNGEIKDPIGLAQSVVGSPNTGLRR